MRSVASPPLPTQDYTQLSDYTPKVSRTTILLVDYYIVEKYTSIIIGYIALFDPY